MQTTSRLAALAACLALAVRAAGPTEPAKGALAADDDCAGAGTCAVNALQHEARRSSFVEVVVDQHAEVGEQREEAATGMEVLSRPLQVETGAPDICDAEIVAQTCSMLNKVTGTYWGTAQDANMSYVYAAELAEQLMVDRSAVLAYLARIGVANRERNRTARRAGSFAMLCSDLCRKTVGAIPAGRLPPSSDVGCYDPGEGGEPVCDIDLSAGAFQRSAFREHTLAERLSSDVPIRGDDNGTQPGAGTRARRKLLRNRRMANTSQELEELAEMDYPVRSGRQIGLAVANLFRIYPLIGAKVLEERKGEDVPEPGAGPSTLEAAVRSVGSPISPEMRTKVLQLAAQAQAFAARALQNLNSDHSKTFMTAYFGKSDEASRKEVRRVLTGVSDLLSNVYYAKGTKCGPKTFAYVYPEEPYNKNEQGQFVFFLCETLLDAGLDDQIETLVHESTHHETMLTQDEQLCTGQPVCVYSYGRTLCKELARIEPEKAIRNADSFAFFTNDVQPNPLKPECPTYPSCSLNGFCGCTGGRLRTEMRTPDNQACFLCMNGLPPGASTDTGGKCSWFNCRPSRAANCEKGHCICPTGFHSDWGKCVVN